MVLVPPFQRGRRPASVPVPVQQPAPPSSPYGVKAEMFLTSWTDISTYVYQRDTVTVQRGRPNEAASMQPGQATLTLNNRDGRFTTRNPMGAYYPNLVQNTPLRLSVPASAAGLSNYLRFEGDTTSSVTTPDKAALQITGPIDVRVDCWPSDYQACVLAAKWGSTAKSWVFALNGSSGSLDGKTNKSPNYTEMNGFGTLGFYWFDSVNGNLGLDSVVPIPYYGQRIALRVLFTPSTGTAQFFTAPTMAGPFTQLGTNQAIGIATTMANGAGQAVQIGGGPLQPGGVSSIFSGNLKLTGMLGMVYEAQILSGTTLVADPVFSAQSAATASFFDAQNNQWTLNGTAEISSRLYRFHGEMGSFPKAADPSATDVYSQAAAYGITKRLQNSNTPLQSPMRRAMVRLPSTLNLAAYWPCEDAAGSTSIGSATGGQSMQIYSGGVFGTTLQLAANSDFACSSPLPVMGGEGFLGPIVTPAGFTWQDNVMRFVLEVPAAGDVNNSTVAQMVTTGAVGYVTLVYTTASNGTLTMNGFGGAGGVLLTGGGAQLTGVNGQRLRVSLELVKSGSTTSITLVTLAAGAATTSSAGVSGGSGGPPGAVTAVQVGAPGINSSVIGHVSVQGVWDDLFDVAGALNAWNGEPAAARIARLCSEEGIASRIVGSQAASMLMGNQGIDTLMNLLQQCENTDLGMLYEPRQALGIGYRTRSSLYHQTPLATVSYSSGHLFQGFAATGDTQLAVNDITASAPSGSTAQQTLTTGAMSILAPPNGISRVNTQISPSPKLDSQLTQIASWHLNVRSVDDDRYPSIPFQMARTETPLTVALLDTGDYLQITGTPSWLPPPPIRQLAAGFSEVLFPAALWELDINGIPELPYETAQSGAAGGHNSAKPDTAGSQLTAGITSTATSFQVTIQAGSQVWTQAAGDFPFDIICEGEQMTVSNITGATSPQTFTISARSVNGVVKAHNAGAAVSLYHKCLISL